MNELLINTKKKIDKFPGLFLRGIDYQKKESRDYTVFLHKQITFLNQNFVH